jgi:hypothetical protein
MKHFNWKFRFVINNLLIITALIMTLSGMVLQIKYHMMSSEQHHQNQELNAAISDTYVHLRNFDTTQKFWNVNYYGWSLLHKISIKSFSIVMIFHFYFHLEWYKGVIRKNMQKKNIQVMILTLLFFLVAITGFIPWIIELTLKNSQLILTFIEIHDKLTLLFIILLLLHFLKRMKWYQITYNKF